MMLATRYWSSTLFVMCMYLSAVLASNTSCPTWFYYNNATCQCGQFIDWRVQCNQQEMKVEIADGFCTTSTAQEGQYYAGYCPFRHTQNNTDRMFSELPSNPDLLNDTMCGPYNRKGLLCGRCIDGYGPAVYSIDMECANCSMISTGSAIFLYLFLELIPITLFFMCVVIFHLNITAGPLLGYVLFCQLYYSYFIGQDVFIYKYLLSHVSTPLQIVLYLSMALSSLWVLQFFKFIIPPFCISSKLTDIHVELLNLVTAIYPIMLVIITCILIELHAKNYRIIHILWKPFSILLNRFKVTSVTSDAAMRAFATFILLSASTLSYSILSFFENNPVLRSTDGTIYKKVLVNDATITAFSHEHILYAVLTLVPTTFLVLIPSLLLCVYPTRIYRFLSRFASARKRLAITAFAEALNNCFKDGLNGTRDYRALAGCIIAGIIVVTLVGKITRIALHIDSTFTSIILLTILSLVFSYVKPCKLTIANLSLTYHCIVAEILSVASYHWIYYPSTETETLENILIFVPTISHILVFMWVGYSLIRRIMSHFGCQFNPHDSKVALTEFATIVKAHFNRQRYGYDVLPDS